jgi:ribonuclease-3
LTTAVGFALVLIVFVFDISLGQWYRALVFSIIQACIKRGEERQAGREKASLLANALEALLGAVYLDGGLEAAVRLTERWFSPLIATALPGQDFKTSLQELTHARYKAPPSYHLMAESGPGHARHFKVEVRLQDLPMAQGEGRTKKEAEQRAARRALAILADEGAAPEGDDAPG